MSDGLSHIERRDAWPMVGGGTEDREPVEAALPPEPGPVVPDQELPVPDPAAPLDPDPPPPEPDAAPEPEPPATPAPE